MLQSVTLWQAISSQPRSCGTRRIGTRHSLDRLAARKVTAEQVREDLDRPLKDSTVRTVLRRSRKGLLAHSVEDRTFIYRPRIAAARSRPRRQAHRRLVLRGLVEALLVGMVDSKVLDRAELRRLAEHIAAAQKNAPHPKKEA